MTLIIFQFVLRCPCETRICMLSITFVSNFRLENDYPDKLFLHSPYYSDSSCKFFACISCTESEIKNQQIFVRERKLFAEKIPKKSIHFSNNCQQDTNKCYKRDGSYPYLRGSIPVFSG